MFKLEVGNLSVRTPEAVPSFPGSSAHLGRGPTGPRPMTLDGSLAAQALLPRGLQPWPPLSSTTSASRTLPQFTTDVPQGPRRGGS